jgi:hypothetical protein
MKLIIVQSGNFRFYYGRFTKTDDPPTHKKKMVVVDPDNRDPVDNLHVEIPIFIIQPYQNKGPEDDRAIHSIWQNSAPNPDQLKKIMNFGYGSLFVVETMLESFGFVKIDKQTKIHTATVIPGAK